MFTINRTLLKSKLIAKGMTMDGLATDLGIDRTTFYRRLRDATLTVGNVHRIIEVLGLSEQETIAIFLSQSVA